MLSSNRVFIIAEAGSNWRYGTKDKDIQMAKSLIDAAVDAGANAVKFQLYKAETTYVPNAGDSDYLKESGIKKSIVEIFEEHSMPYEMIPILADYCKSKKIEFMCSPFSIADAKAVNPYVNIHKIASYEITHSHLIEYIASTNKSLILSTGAATIDEIEWAITHYRKNGGKEIALMQCTAKYPAPLSSLNLRVIPQLIKKFNIPVGFSDHSKEPTIGPLLAIALGATIIEKHMTLDKKLPGPDHSFALTPTELKEMILSIRKAEVSLGSDVKTVLDDEIELRNYAQRSLQAIKNIKKGEVLEEGKNFDILRSGKQKKGIHPKYIQEIEGKKARRDIPLGDGIRKGDF